MSRAGESVKNIGKKSASNAAEGSKMQQTIGFSDEKRKVAISLGVDPYRTNTVLQSELDGIAWASFAGGLTFQIATMPISGPRADNHRRDEHVSRCAEGKISRRSQNHESQDAARS